MNLLSLLLVILLLGMQEDINKEVRTLVELLKTVDGDKKDQAVASLKTLAAKKPEVARPILREAMAGQGKDIRALLSEVLESLPTLSASLEVSEVRTIGQPLRIRIKITNHSSRETWIVRPRAGSDIERCYPKYSLTIRTPDGKESPLSSYLLTGDSCLLKADCIALMPGEEKDPVAPGTPINAALTSWKPTIKGKHELTLRVDYRSRNMEAWGVGGTEEERRTLAAFIDKVPKESFSASVVIDVAP